MVVVLVNSGWSIYLAHIFTIDHSPFTKDKPELQKLNTSLRSVPAVRRKDRSTSEGKMVSKFTCKTWNKFLPFIHKPKSTIMKKWLIGSIVGGIIVFLWQFLSWMKLPIHSGEAKYTPAQTEILNSLSASIKEDGMYMLPTVQPGASMEDHEKLMKENDGKPRATLIYRSNYKIDMVRPMIRGFLVDLVLVFLLIYIITRAGTPTAMRIFAASIALGLFTFLVGPYTMHNWFQTPTEAYTGHLIDAFVTWGLVGIWLGWWLNRK